MFITRFGVDLLYKQKYSDNMHLRRGYCSCTVCIFIMLFKAIMFTWHFHKGHETPMANACTCTCTWLCMDGYICTTYIFEDKNVDD